MKKFLTLAAFLALLVWWLHEPDAAWPGMPAAREPQQSTANLPPEFSSGAYRVTPLAHYEITAVVLARERYRHDRGAELSPLDLALGWGSMSSASAINELSFSQSGRWYNYSWGSEGAPLEPASIALQSANTHCLPATPELRKKLLSVRRHQLVTLTGYLVEVTGPDNYRWRSSLTRDDTRGGSCEVFWLTDVRAVPIAAAR